MKKAFTQIIDRIVYLVKAFKKMRMMGVEPTRALHSQDSESCLSTNSNTPATTKLILRFKKRVVKLFF